MTTPAWISLGSNLGDRRAILDEAVIRLNQTPGVAVTAVSTYRETRPVGGPPGQGPFLNAAARLDTTLSPRELLGALQAIERDLGRVRTVRWGERTLDLDLLIFDGVTTDEPDLRLPHPRIAVRRFVLEPLAEIAPDAVESRTGRTVTDLLGGLDRKPHYLLVDESIQLKVPRLLIQLQELLAGVRIQYALDDVICLLERSGSFDRELWIRARMELVDRVVAQCLNDGSKRWLLGSTNVGQWWKWRSPLASIRFHESPSDPSEDDRQSRLVERLWQSSRTTLIVAFRPPRRRCQVSGPSSVPIYWAEATEPDAIVAEVVAVCRGIEGV